MTEVFGEAWSPMSVPDLAPDDDDDWTKKTKTKNKNQTKTTTTTTTKHHIVIVCYILHVVFQHSAGV